MAGAPGILSGETAQPPQAARAVINSYPNRYLAGILWQTGQP